MTIDEIIDSLKNAEEISTNDSDEGENPGLALHIVTHLMPGI